MLLHHDELGVAWLGEVVGSTRDAHLTHGTPPSRRTIQFMRPGSRSSGRFFFIVGSLIELDFACL